MAWLVTGAVLASPAPPSGGDGFVPWYIKEGEITTVPSCREMAVHGELVIDGELIIEEDARLVLET